MGSLCIEFVSKETESIQSAKAEDITLKVKGTNRDIVFIEPLELLPLQKTANSGKISPAQVSVGSGVGGDVTFAFEAMEDITLDSISLGEYAELENMTVSIAEKTTTKAKQVGGLECLPLMVQKGNVFVVRGTVKSDYFTGYQSIDTITTIRYSAGGESHIEQHNLFLATIDDVEDVTFCIDALFDQGVIK